MQDTNKKCDAIVNICLNPARKVLGETPKSNNSSYENEEIILKTEEKTQILRKTEKNERPNRLNTKQETGSKEKSQTRS